MNLNEVITELYEHEINCGLQVQWNGGVFVWIGGDGGHKHEHCFSIKDIGQVAAWLDAKARASYPDSFIATAIPPTF
jgi:hypothetical protein